MTFARRNNLSVYSGVSNVISVIVMPCSGQYTASGDLGGACVPILMALLRICIVCASCVDSSSWKRACYRCIS